MFNQMMLAGRSAITKNITISGNQTDWNLIADGFGGVAPIVRSIVTITVNSGVLMDSSVGADALNAQGLPANSTILLVNNGDIIGRGGNAGKGGTCLVEVDEGPTCIGSGGTGLSGSDGRDAIIFDGSGVDLTIDNTNGNIYGGGGGGGGGNGCKQDSPCLGAGGSGGGGGAGGGNAGIAGSGSGLCIPGNPGSSGGTGVSGTAGSGGGGVTNGCSTGAGGAGGEYGLDGGGANGGTAGKAVENNGTGTVTFTGGNNADQVKGTVE